VYSFYRNTRNISRIGSDRFQKPYKVLFRKSTFAKKKSLFDKRAICSSFKEKDPFFSISSDEKEALFYYWLSLHSLNCLLQTRFYWPRQRVGEDGSLVVEKEMSFGVDQVISFLKIVLIWNHLSCDQWKWKGPLKVDMSCLSDFFNKNRTLGIYLINTFFTARVAQFLWRTRNVLQNINCNFCYFSLKRFGPFFERFRTCATV